jgi:hypothetical protein
MYFRDNNFVSVLHKRICLRAVGMVCFCSGKCRGCDGSGYCSHNAVDLTDKKIKFESDYWLL